MEMGSFKETFDHFIGEGGRGGTKGFHEGLIRKVDVQVAEIRFLGQSPRDSLERRPGGAI